MACGAPAQVPAGSGSTQPKQGGVLNLPTTDDMSDWDMRVNGQTAQNADGLHMAYNSLIGFKASPYPNANYVDSTLVPEMADSWDISPDAKTFTFHLRKDIKWANTAPVNGRQFTSADVKWTYEYQGSAGEFSKLPAGQNSFMFEGMDAITTPDPYTVVIKFKSGFAPFINYAGAKLNPIYPKELAALEGGLTTNIVGTGPWMWDKADTQKGSRWVFTKNPDSFEASQAYVNTIRWIVLKDDATTQAAFTTKQIDFYPNTDGKAIQEVQKANPNASSFDYVTGPRYLLMNFARPPLDNMKVRQAVNRAIDREAFIKVLGGKGKWGLAGTNMWDDLFSQEDVKKIVSFNLAEAKQLMAEAGYANGTKLSFMYDTSSQLDNVLVPLLQSQLKQIGIDMVLDGRTRTQVGADRKVGDFQMHWFSEYPRPDPDATLFSTFVPKQRGNYTATDDAKLTQLVTAQRQEPDAAKRRELIKQAVKYLNETALGFAIDRPVASVLWHPYVKEYAPHQDYGSGRGRFLGLWLDK